MTGMQIDPASLILWGTDKSPYVRKVMIALKEKHLDYQHFRILPALLLKSTGQAIPEAFLRASPLGKIPALQIADFSIADSSAILAYLEKKFPDRPRLYPDTSEDYARAIWFECYANETLTDIIHKKIFIESLVKPKILQTSPNWEMIEKIKLTRLPPIFDYLESCIASPVNWLVANVFSIADISIITQLLALQMTSYTINATRWPKLTAYIDYVLARPSLQGLK